jgi:radical SAM protein with 4Fe4S-binding SPASM domain
LNPNATEIIQVIREELPESSIMVTSNGGNLLHDPGPVDRVKALFDAGLNCLALDDYIGVPIVPRIRLALNRPMPGIQVYNYPPDSGGNPYIRRKSTDRIITYLADLTTTAGDHKIGVRDNICNQTGAAGPLNDRFKGHRCARPFRELCVRFDGRLMLCCNDWRGQFKVGSVMDKPLNELWQADQLQAARLKLYHGDREWGPCKGCDSKSYRPGLLPDPMGRAILPLATARDEAILEMACAGDSMTQAVLRPWEQPSAVIEPQLLNEPFVRREPMEMSEPRDMREPGI